MKAKPEWLKVRAGQTQNSVEVQEILDRLSLHTVCEEANCPNMRECFSRRTATFMILGNICTRNCTFCNVQKSKPTGIDPEEPVHVAQAVKELRLKHVVITSVTRDDLPDGGAQHFSNAITEIRRLDQRVIIEVLIPDFQGDEGALAIVAAAKPNIINHNVETVPRLYSSVRPMALYERSLRLLASVKAMDSSIYTKSGIMVGLGEEEHEVLGVFKDLRSSGCDILTVGQYLSPSAKHHPIIEYIHPDIFEKYRAAGINMGFKYVASAPLVRSSYLADKALDESV